MWPCLPLLWFEGEMSPSPMCLTSGPFVVVLFELAEPLWRKCWALGWIAYPHFLSALCLLTAKAV